MKRVHLLAGMACLCLATAAMGQPSQSSPATNETSPSSSMSSPAEGQSGSRSEAATSETLQSACSRAARMTTGIPTASYMTTGTSTMGQNMQTTTSIPYEDIEGPGRQDLERPDQVSPQPGSRRPSL